MVYLAVCRGRINKMKDTREQRLEIYGGVFGVLLPFFFFMAGSIYLALMNSKDESSFWVFSGGALILGMLLAKDKTHYAEVIIAGMSQKIMMIMVCAFLFSSLIGRILYDAGFVQSMVWVCYKLGISGNVFAVVTFVIAAIIGTSTGTAIGTILTCTPILYPAGYVLGADPAVLLGAIMGGGAFGDNVSPISDTTIASSMTQEADIGGVIRNRMKYALPAAATAACLFFIFGSGEAGSGKGATMMAEFGNPRGLPMLIVPIVIVYLCAIRRHLVEALFWGVIVALVTSLSLRLINFSELFFLSEEGQGMGTILEGFRGGLGVTVFALFVMGMVQVALASGIIDQAVEWVSRTVKKVAMTELLVVGSVLGITAMLNHNVPAILALGEFVKKTGKRFNLDPYRRANLLDVSASTLTYNLPHMLPVILATAFASQFGAEVGAPAVSLVSAGLHNFHSLALFVVIVLAAITGYGRKSQKS